MILNHDNPIKPNFLPFLYLNNFPSFYCCYKYELEKAACVSPVDSALFFSHYSLEVSELEKAVMEIVQVENTRQQEGRGNENPDEQLAQLELLQAQGF